MLLDFNDAPAQDPVSERDLDAERQTIRQALLANLEGVLNALFPAGRVRHGKFFIGDVAGTPGDSLEVVLDGAKAGLWRDRASKEGGDVFDVIARHFDLDVRRQFAEVIGQAVQLLGRAPAVAQASAKKKRDPAIDDLGPATARWDYLDVDGKLIAVVYRYDPPGGKKEFRPWDVKRRKWAPPDPRPLYNLPGLRAADLVVLVEGEKCAQVLIEMGICATTAMQGANGPASKTDWSALRGKRLLIWPDKDKAGWDYAEATGQAALAAGAASVEILLPPEDKPQGWDVADAMADVTAQEAINEVRFDVHGFLHAGPRIPLEPAADTLPPEEVLAGVDWQTEDGLATAFTNRHGDDWRYCAAWGRWFAWDGKRWNADQVLHVLYLARGICRSASTLADTPRLRSRLASASTTAAVERMARSDPQHASTTEQWDIDPWLLNTPQGVINLRTGRVREHRRGDGMTKISTASAHGPCPTWIAFLRDVTGDDAELMAYLQRMAGYCLTGVTTEHALFFLYGTGANGKSVFINTLASIVGDYAANAPMDTFMEARGDRHPTELAGLRGARLVSSIETEQGRRWNESKIKALTGGDKVAARFMRQDFFDYTPQFKLVIAGNHKPSIRNVDEAMKRRMHLIPFTVTIPAERRDGKLTEKLLRERDGILAWALEGCLAWQKQGLSPPESVQAATEEYFEAEDLHGQWMDERAQRMSEARVATAVLYADFRDWCEGRGEYPGTIKRFAEVLISKGFATTRLHGGTRAFRGLSLRQKNSGHHYSDID